MMTVRDIYEGVLIEVRKENFPHIQLRDFNHYLNEAVSEIIDDVYIAFEMNQKSLDYLKAIKKTIKIDTTEKTIPDCEDGIQLVSGEGLYKGSVKFCLPCDYRHLTGVVVKYDIVGSIPDDCYENGDIIEHGSKRIDDDTFASIVNDPFQRPRYFEPKHAIIGNELFVSVGQQLPLTTSLGTKVNSVLFSYLKTPKRYTLTYNQSFQDSVDTSQKLEFDEITNKLILDRVTQKVLERNMDQRTQSHTQINKIQTRQDVLTGGGNPQQQQ